jgi:hypothetical protein
MMKSINWAGVIAALVVTQLLSWVWYGTLFGAALHDLYPTAPPLAGPMTYVEGVVLSLVMLLGVNWIVSRLGSNSYVAGAKTGLFLWVFFPLAGELMRYVYMADPIKAVAIDAGYTLVYMVIGGALIGGLKLGGAKSAA